MGVNVGAMIAPLWCGLVGNTGHPEDFKWGFLSPCIGMLIGASVFQVFKNKNLRTPDGKPVGMPPVSSTKQEETKATASSTSYKRISIAAFFGVILFLLFSINWESFNNPSIGYFEGILLLGNMNYHPPISLQCMSAIVCHLTNHVNGMSGSISR